jgi:alkylation response protein AidB-like acyl-CoA dehydrogenase
MVRVDSSGTPLLSRSSSNVPLALTPDSGAWTILTIHWNLCMGTISSFLSERPDLVPLLQSLECFDTCGEFLLTELGHGLDVRNIETTAIHQVDGSFVLHTPNIRAAKSMPPSSPHSGMARTGVVFARLMVAGKDYGVRPFIVPLNDASGAMYRGVTCTLFPARPGAKAIDHALTGFRHVSLPAEALLGHLQGSPKDERKDFMRAIHRVTVGTLCISTSNATTLRVAGCIAGRYSTQRRVGAPESVPILSFSTQYGPIARILAHAVVFDKYTIEATQLFMANIGKLDMQNVIAGTFKATVLGYTQKALSELVDRCGWQGLYAHNQVSRLLIPQQSCLRKNQQVTTSSRLVNYGSPKRATTSPKATLWSSASDSRVRSFSGGMHRRNRVTRSVYWRATSPESGTRPGIYWRLFTADTAARSSTPASYRCLCR